MQEKIRAVLDQIRPMIQSDGGDIEFVDYKDNIVYVRLKGSCVGCLSADMTLQLLVEDRLKEQIPEIKSIAVAQ